MGCAVTGEPESPGHGDFRTLPAAHVPVSVPGITSLDPEVPGRHHLTRNVSSQGSRECLVSLPAHMQIHSIELLKFNRNFASQCHLMFINDILTPKSFP